MSKQFSHETKRLKEDYEVEDNNLSQHVQLNSNDSQRNLSERRLRHLPIRQRTPCQPSNNCYLQIYGTGFDTGETVATVLLFFDQQRFIFNIGEGLQRFCTEHRIKLSKIDHIFLTRICAETAGGLPGLLLTLAGINEIGMTVQVSGPEELDSLVNAIRCFVPSAATLHTYSFGDGLDQSCGGKKLHPVKGVLHPIVLVENESVKISAVLLYPTGERELQKDKASTRISAVYICELSKVLGKFDPKKALAKGLKPGSKYGRLQRGESVMSDDGLQNIDPEDVLGPSSPGPITMLVDCPHFSYLHALLSVPSMKMYYSGSGKSINCIVHLSPPSVTNHELYQEWMSKFNDAHHLMAGRDGMSPGLPILKSSAYQLSKLNHICPDLFPIFGFLEAERKNLVTDKSLIKMKRAVAAENLMKFRLRPISALGLDTSSVPESFWLTRAQEQFASDCKTVLEAKECLSSIWQEAKKGDKETIPECVLHGERDELEIVFLGTGSSQPSKYRNVSGIYLHLHDKGGILLDCGEGTYAQFKRRYGSEMANDILQKLKCIWISHIHADHHAGLPLLLSARRRVLAGNPVDNPILVIGPKSLARVLYAYEKVEELAMVFLDNSQTTSAAAAASKDLKHNEFIKTLSDEGLEALTEMEDSGVNIGQAIKLQQGLDVRGQSLLKTTLDSMGLQRLESVEVVHCHNAYGVVIESQPKRNQQQNNQRPGWKLVYSGDTRPCEALADACHGATVLIHEATFDDSMAMEAISKNHSITKEAIAVGMSAGVYRIILTHFSQRYPKIPVFDESYTSKTCVAFDMMSVNLVDLPLLPQLLPALRMLFQDETLFEDEDLPAT